MSSCLLSDILLVTSERVSATIWLLFVIFSKISCLLPSSFSPSSFMESFIANFCSSIFVATEPIPSSISCLFSAELADSTSIPFRIIFEVSTSLEETESTEVATTSPTDDTFSRSCSNTPAIERVLSEILSTFVLISSRA